MQDMKAHTLFVVAAVMALQLVPHNQDPFPYEFSNTKIR